MKSLTLQKLMEVGAHYGSLTTRWNPKMAPYIYGQRNNFYIFDLEKTIACLKRAMHVTQEISQSNGTILFLGTDEISSQCVRYYAKKSGQFYLHKSWFGGTLTNWKHFSNFLNQLQTKEELLLKQPKKDVKSLKKVLRLAQSLEGIRSMESLPSLLIVLNTQKHKIAIKEANLMNIPVIGVVDTDCDPEGITYPIPGNNDNVACMKLYCELLAESVQRS